MVVQLLLEEVPERLRILLGLADELHEEKGAVARARVGPFLTQGGGGHTGCDVVSDRGGRLVERVPTEKGALGLGGAELFVEGVGDL